MPDVPVDRIDRYEILGELGRGATGIVFKARDPELDRLVAIKTLRPERQLLAEQCGQPERRLRREAAAVARLNHPNIVAIHDVVVWDDTPCIVMEFIEGCTLAHLVAQGPLVPARAIDIVSQVCHALEYAHALGVVHGDIKPGNILVGKTGLAKLGDFSIAALAGSRGKEAGTMVGTPGYIAPEQLAAGVTDARSDLFSLGVVLYEAVTGVRAFPGSDLASVLYDVAHVEPTSPRTFNAAVTPALTAVVRHAMSKQPEARYDGARALADALARVPDVKVPAAGRGALRRVGPALALGVASLVIAGSARGPFETPRTVASPAEHSTSARSRPTIATEVGRPVGTPARGLDAASVVPPPERSGRRAIVSIRANSEQTPARADLAATARRAPEPAAIAGSSGPQGCLSGNAIPFATVVVDGQVLGETPAACLRVPLGEHRVQLRQGSDQSPERLVRVAEEHTVDRPVRVIYDFRSQQFGD